MAFTVMFVLVLSSLQRYVECLDFRVTTTQRCLLSETYFLRLYGVTRNQCVSECSKRRRCLYLSHRRTPFNICHLIEDSFTGSGSNGIGTEDMICTYVQKSGILTDLSASCNCSDREVCDPDTGSCSFKQCDFIEDPTNGIVIGNMNSVGSKVKVECIEGYEEIMGVYYSMCSSNGEWSYFPRCVPDDRLSCEDDCQGSSYVFSNVRRTRDEAKAECESTGGQLAKISSDEEFTFLKEEAERNYHDYWIGLMRRDDGEFAWDDGSLLDYNQWHTGEPNSSGGCVRLKRSASFNWADDDCLNRRHYICEYSAE